MKSFLQRHTSEILGVLRGLDRVRFRGTFRSLAYTGGMMGMLSQLGVLLKDFRHFAEATTTKLRDGVRGVAEQANRHVRYLASSQTDKEKFVDRIVEKEGVGPGGLLAVLSAVETCQSYELYRNRQRKILELVPRRRKCLHYYVYFRDPMFGRVHVRMQTWFPFSVHLVINGREWLSRQLDAAKVGYLRRENCFAWVDDFACAQKLLDRQLRIHWPKHLNRLLTQANPALSTLLRPWGLHPYWSAEQSEWATDIAFDSAGSLGKLYPRLIQHAMTSFGSREVMRFLGRKVPAQGGVHGRFAGEIITDLAARPEGIRIKHRVDRNSIKMYDKQGSVLRIETTINNACDLKAYRPKEGDPQGPKSYRPLRKGVADLHRRAQLCDAANQRYLEGLAAADTEAPLKTVTDKLCQPAWRNGRRHRALDPFGRDAALLKAVLAGEFLIKGFRHADLRTALFGSDPDDFKERRRRSSRVTRLLGLLRAHGLIKKVLKTHRYMLTANAPRSLPAIQFARETSIDKLMPAA